LDQLRRQAKELLKAFLAGEAHAVAEVDRYFRGGDPVRFQLHHAQLVLARSYGFESWPKLKAFVDGVTIGRLVEAVRAGNVEQTRACLRLRPELADREAPASHGLAPLHFAVQGRMPEMVRALMEAGANPFLGTAGIYALRQAAAPFAMAQERGYEEIVAIMRDSLQRREAGTLNEAGIPDALSEKMARGDEDGSIDLLTVHPELIRSQVADAGWTPLHIASAMLLPRLTVWLLDHGVDVNCPTSAGLSPLDVVGLQCNPGDGGTAREALARILLERRGELTPRAAVILGDKEFLRKKAVVDNLGTARNEDGWLLRLAVDSDQQEVLELLLELGLDPDARVRVDGDDRITYTWGMPLYQCARYGKHAMAKVLLEHGADPNGQVYASGTPLSEAYGQGDSEMVALLERFGGKSNASMAGLYRRTDLALRLLDEYGDRDLPDDGFSKGPVAEQLLGAAARGGDPTILQLAMERVKIPFGDPRWNGLLQGPLGFWNHWIGPWCRPEWDRTTYLTCFKMILTKSGPPNAPLNGGATILHQVVVMGDHVRSEERLAFAIAALDAGARMDLRDDLLKSTPLGWACRWGHEDLVRLFPQRGADAVESDAEPWATPVAWAEKKGHDAVLALLRRRQ
jgi:ankyrin repeat protein